MKAIKSLVGLGAVALGIYALTLDHATAGGWAIVAGLIVLLDS